jgi:hypothetical protein
MRTGVDPLFSTPPSPERQTGDLPLFGGDVVGAERFEAARARLRAGPATARVLALLLDQEAHTVAEIRAVGGDSGDRRLRELRDLGFTVVAEPNPDATAGHYARLYRLFGATGPRVAEAERQLLGRK